MIKKNSILFGDSLEIMKIIPSKSVDLIFADPPYNTDPWVDLMQELENNSLPSDDVLVVCEHISKLQLSVKYGNFFRSRTRKYGDTCISIYEL